MKAEGRTVCARRCDWMFRPTAWPVRLPRMSHTILLVDDNQDNREIYGMFLEHSGYIVLQAFAGEEGVRLAREHRPDLVLMDIGMAIMADERPRASSRQILPPPTFR